VSKPPTTSPLTARARPGPPNPSRSHRTRLRPALTRDYDRPRPLSGVFGSHPLWTLLYESAARAQEALSCNVTDLNTANRCAVVVRKGGARDVIVWQTGTARLLPRMLAGRRRGPVFLTHRAARPSVALIDIDPTTGKARLSYRRAAELFQAHTTSLAGGPFTLHQPRHSALTHAAETGASTPIPSLRHDCITSCSS
jgi:integrase